MGFVKTPKELEELKSISLDFYDDEFLSIYWETKPEIIERLLPPPLKPVKYPVVNAFIANPRTNFCSGYKEAGLFLFAKYENVIGTYCLAMPVDNDMALISGRELFGYPKKMSTIHFKKTDKEAEGWIERHGIKFFEAKAKLTNKMNAKDALRIALELGLNPNDPGSIGYNFKYFRSPNYEGFDYNPHLIRLVTNMRPSKMIIGEIDIKINHSDDDPWYEIEIERVLGCAYLRSNNQMQPGEVIAEVESEKFEPYSFMKIDSYNK